MISIQYIFMWWRGFVIKEIKLQREKIMDVRKKIKGAGI